MSHALIVTREAEADILNGYQSYEEKQQGLGRRFLDEIERSLSHIGPNPFLYQEVEPDIRRAVAERMAGYASVMAYDLVNESVAVGGDDRESEWWTGELDGLRYVQRINLRGNGRSQDEIAEAWTRKMIGAIREADTRHLITLGNLSDPDNAFGPDKAGQLLDFASPHIYPDSNGKSIAEAVDEAIAIAEAFAAAGKPVIVTETYTLTINETGLESFVRGARGSVAGFASHYFGLTESEHDETDFLESLHLAALRQWIRLGPVLKQAAPPRVPL